MYDECKLIGKCPTGNAVLTKGYKLPAKYCIHAVGPTRENPDKLASAYNSSLRFIDGNEIKSIGFCCISTGIYGYPILRATQIAMHTVRTFWRMRKI